MFWLAVRIVERGWLAMGCGVMGWDWSGKEGGVRMWRDDHSLDGVDSHGARTTHWQGVSDVSE